MAPEGSRRPSPWMALAGLVVALALRAIGATWRVRVIGDDPLRRDERGVGAVWHESLFLSAYYFRDRRFVVMVSRSRDGDWIEAVLSRLGYARSARGSSSRGGASALRQQVELVRGGATAAVLCDGPRGPAREAKLGVVGLAQAAGASLYPVVLRARPALRASSWDRTIVPFPFSRVLVAWGSVIPVPQDADRAQLAAVRDDLQRALDALEERCDRELGTTR